MKSKAKAKISFLLTLVMLFGLIPTTAFAADDEMVLTTIGHPSAVQAVNVTGTHSPSLVVPDNYVGSVDLSSGLELTYDTSLYTSVSARFPAGSVASVGAEPVTMTVSYQKTNDTAVYTANYQIRVIKASYTAPAFSGAVLKTLTLPGSLTLAASDFTGQYTKNDGGALAAVIITGTNPAIGSLKLGDQAYAGESVSLADLEAGRLIFSATGEGAAAYTVKAYAAGDDQTPIGSVSLTITVQKSANSAAVTYATNRDTPVALRQADFVDAFHTASGETLASVKFTLPSAASGKLYYNYRSPSDYDAIVFADTQYQASSLSNITFVPATGFSGTVNISYSGYNTAGVAALPGKLVINVDTVNTGNVAYTTEQDTPVSFDASDFEAVCANLTGKALSYIKFTLPSSASGKLYYNYRTATDYDSLIFADTAYHASGYPSLSSVDFVPASGYAGTASIIYTGTTTEGGTYTGEIKITVAADSDDEDEDEDEDDSCHFSDVGKHHKWAFGAINYLYRNRVILGDQKGFYNPNASISRGDFILMLCRAFNLKADKSGNFSDVEANSYYYDAIATAKALKIVKGANGKFNPRSSLSRQDAMVLIARALEAAGVTIDSPDENSLEAFSDRDNLSDYAVSAASSLVKAKTIQGSGKKLNPKSSISRAEIAVLLYRILNK